MCVLKRFYISILEEGDNKDRERESVGIKQGGGEREGGIRDQIDCIIAFKSTK